MSLKTVLTGFLIVTAVGTAAAAAALIFLTTILGRSVDTTADSVESIRVAEELEVALLSHERTQDPAVRARMAHRIRVGLREVQSYVSTPEEAAVLDRVGRLLKSYLDAPSPSPGPDLEAAIAALEELIQLNVEQARDSQRIARRWNDIGDGLGFGVIAILFASATAAAIILPRYVFRPVVRVSESLSEFARGNREVRLPDRGLAEIRLIGHHFNRMAEALADHQRAQLAFLGGVVHDLRNPLAAMKILVAAAIRDPSPDPAEDREALVLVEEQIGHLDRMMKDLLDAARIEAGGLTLHRGPCDLRKVAQTVHGLYRGFSKVHELELQIGEVPAVVHGDPLRLEQVVVNLVSNAIKYSPAGGPVRIQVERREGEACVSVSDQGLGISEEDQNHLFEPFRRVGAGAESIPGAGLGLSVVRRIITAHGGRIELSSAPGKGTTFRVCLGLAGADSDGCR